MPSKFSFISFIQCVAGFILLCDGNIFMGMIGTALLIGAALTVCTGTIIGEMRRVWPLEKEPEVDREILEAQIRQQEELSKKARQDARYTPSM